MIAKLSSCLQDSPTLLRIYAALYKRLYKGFASNVKVVSGSSKIEERRVIWTNYNNINVWFNTLRDNLIVMGFARVKFEAEAGKGGELVFFPGQLNCILNLDESGHSLDGNHSLSAGGRSSTRFGSTNRLIPSRYDQN